MNPILMSLLDEDSARNTLDYAAQIIYDCIYSFSTSTG